MKIFITGGLGFIGGHFLLDRVPLNPEIEFINFDAMTYSANPEINEILASYLNYRFIKGDIYDAKKTAEIVREEQPDIIVHFAAESHVDRSILGPMAFVETNVVGTVNLLEGCKKAWNGNYDSKLFFHISTDEVYGSLGETGFFAEDTPYSPRSPYSASKASSDHFVQAYNETYGLPTIITNCSNNYGPYQFPEKLIPLMIMNLVHKKPLPVYGAGLNVRDWIYVKDHCDAIWHLIRNGKIGEKYNIGGNSEKKNIEVVYELCQIVSEILKEDVENFKSLITYVEDRPGHDLRYAIDSTKMKTQMKWEPKYSFTDGLRSTVKWYLENQDWLKAAQSGEFQKWIESNYSSRTQK